MAPLLQALDLPSCDGWRTWRSRFSEGVFGLLAGAGEAPRDRARAPEVEVERRTLRIVKHAGLEVLGKETR
jgi:hypothetical protein